MVEFLSVFILDNDCSLSLYDLAERNCTCNLCDYCRILWLAGFKEFRYTWKTESDIVSLCCSLCHLGECSSGFNLTFILDIVAQESSNWHMVRCIFISVFVSDADTWLFYIKVEIRDTAFNVACLLVFLNLKSNAINDVFIVDITGYFSNDWF